MKLRMYTWVYPRWRYRNNNSSATFYFFLIIDLCFLTWKLCSDVDVMASVSVRLPIRPSYSYPNHLILALLKPRVDYSVSSIYFSSVPSHLSLAYQLHLIHPVLLNIPQNRNQNIKEYIKEENKKTRKKQKINK